jgi:serine/threonine protein kinase
MDEDAKTIADNQPTTGDVTLANGAAGSKVFGRYRLEKELGRGGMGVVWLAHDERVDVHIALKFLPDVVARDAECVDELKRELRRGLNLTHPGIVRVYSFEQDEQGAAISMEYVDGTTLGALKLKQQSGCFEWDELLPWIEQLCAALDYAHEEARIVHRDLKPRNLMLTTKNRLKIADFGVATSISDTVSRATIRKDGSGTPPYMSPQQAFGENPSPSDDIYSLGATLYELLTSRPPFYQGNILAQVQQRMAPSMTERRDVLRVTDKKPIPEHWEKTIAACLSKHVEDRPQRASEVLDELRGLRRPPESVPVERPINPAVTLSTAGADPIGGGKQRLRIMRLCTTVGRKWRPNATPPRYNPPPPPPADVATSRGVDLPQKKSGSPGLAVAALGSIILLGGAGWWWWQQQRHSQQGPVATEVPAGATPIPVSTPDPQLEAKRLTEEQAQKAQMEQSQADSAAAAAGKIPKAGRAVDERHVHEVCSGTRSLLQLVAEHETRLIDYRTFAAETKRPADSDGV